MARRLARHHPATVAPSLHALVLLAAPIIDALRSTMARLAIALFQVGAGRLARLWWGCRRDIGAPYLSLNWSPLMLQDLAEGLGPALDAELEAFVPLLLKRAGQVQQQVVVWVCGPWAAHGRHPVSYPLLPP